MNNEESELNKKYKQKLKWLGTKGMEQILDDEMKKIEKEIEKDETNKKR